VIEIIVIKPDFICNLNCFTSQAQTLGKRDIVVGFSNGGFGGIHAKLLERLGRR
jgi:hypothetical protein